jgi:hypothetical protein
MRMSPGARRIISRRGDICGTSSSFRKARRMRSMPVSRDSKAAFMLVKTFRVGVEAG